ncbi:MAG: zinc ribbon domain-containing protein [Synoicihabitans sp.]
MPTYDYACTKCGNEWEVFQSMKDDPIKTCPSCKKRSAKRLVGGGAGLIFKGSGFYITDYKNKPASDSKSGGENAKPASSDKPAAKPAKADS